MAVAVAVAVAVSGGGAGAGAVAVAGLTKRFVNPIQKDFLINVWGYLHCSWSAMQKRRFFNVEKALLRGLRVVIFISSHILRNFSVLAGGRCPPDPPNFGWGGQSPPDPPLNSRPQQLIEAAKRGRLDQMLFFSAPFGRP